MRWLITGANGMLGRDLHALLREEDEDIVAVDLAELDITDRDAVRHFTETVRPDVIVNCAAWTKVDDAEEHEEAATRVNATAVGWLAEAASRWDSVLAQISTDFVFDGASNVPYEVTDDVGPISAYGRSKLKGEVEAARAAKHVIVRTSWLFGRHGWNFVEAIRKQLASGKRELRVVNDQVGKPTYTPHLAAALVRLSRLAEREEASRGVFHYSDEEACSWFDFARAIVAELERRGEVAPGVVVHPVSSAEFPRPAARPAWSVLSTARYERVTGARPESWREGLADYLG